MQFAVGGSLLRMVDYRKKKLDSTMLSFPENEGLDKQRESENDPSFNRSNHTEK